MWRFYLNEFLSEIEDKYNLIDLFSSFFFFFWCDDDYCLNVVYFNDNYLLQPLMCKQLR